MEKTVCGVGHLGLGVFKPKDNKKIYNIWKSILRRCTDTRRQEVKERNYKNVIIEENFLDFDKFCNWVLNFSNYKEGWHLDKDLLSGEYKKYSFDTCIFIPQFLNKFMKGEYCNNSVGLKGVTFNKLNKKFVSQIRVNGRVVYLGNYKNKEEAHEKYISYRKSVSIIMQQRALAYGLTLEQVKKIK